MPSKQLAKNTYRKFFEEIAGIYDGALKDARLAELWRTPDSTDLAMMN